MRALKIAEGLQFHADVAQPQPSDDQALLKMRVAGICNTDLELVQGYMGFAGIPGHEFVADVVAGPDALLGQRVVGEINVADGTCEFCKKGVPSQCSDRTTVGIDRHDGAMADYLALATRNLYVVPGEVRDDAAVFVEPLAAALQVTEAVHISPRDRVLVVGVGKLGMLVAQVLKLTGADVVALIRREKQAKLLDRWHIPYGENGDFYDNTIDVVVDCTGTAEGFAISIGLVKPRGTVVLKSTYTGIPQADLTRVAIDEIRVIGSRCGPFDAALRMLHAGMIDTEPLIDGRYEFDDALTAFEAAAQPGAMKYLLDF